MKPMLAKSFLSRYLKGDHFYIQPKLDGMRMIWTGREALSRKGKPVMGVPKLIESLGSSFPDIPLDGELYCHGKPFQDIISSTRRTVNIQEDESVEYHVYDMPIEGMSFEQRLEKLNALELPERVVRVRTVKLWITEDFYSDEALNIFEREGYEGTMARNADAHYQFGKRSSDLLKIKTFQDAEFEITGVIELRNYEKLIVEPNTPGANQYADGRWYKNGAATPMNTCGALLCKTEDGKEFEVGSGMDDATRLSYWATPPTGKLLTVKYQGLTNDGIPRFPIHKTLRDYE